MRTRIKKSTQKVEFCFSTVVFEAKKSNLDEIKAELSLVNSRLSKIASTPKKPVGVRFKIFGEFVERSLEIVDKLEKAHISYEIIYR